MSPPVRFLRAPGELIVPYEPDSVYINGGVTYGIHKLTRDQLRNLARDAVKLALDEGIGDLQVRPAAQD